MHALKCGLILSILLLPVQAAETLLSKHQLEPGIYVWDGLAQASSPEPLPGGVGAVDHAGFHAVRLLLSPASRRTYSLPPFRCPEGQTSLKCLVLSEPYHRALAITTMNVVMFTTYDFTSFSRQHYLDSPFLQANRQQVFDEYRDLAETLMHQYSGSGRVFIIGHWEGDNQVYCGSSYNFQTVEAKRFACMDQNPGDRLAGMTEWLKIRQEAIADGRKRALATGATNVEVYHAAEFNTIFASHKLPERVSAPRIIRGCWTR